MGEQMNNFWGDPDDEPLPDWMNPETYQNNGKMNRMVKNKSVEEVAAEALTKPPVPIIIKPPSDIE
jgi:hypothetical protein